MTTVPFSKYHGLGNDFILVDAIGDESLCGADWELVAPRWCDRRLGIGADGILLLCGVPGIAGVDADLEMRVYNADGTRAPMCGNGVRCVAKYMAERRGVRGERLRLATLAGPIELTWATGPDGRVGALRVDMGPARLRASDIPVRTDLARIVDMPLRELAMDGLVRHAEMGAGPLARALGALDAASVGGAARVTCVSMGNPHAVVFVRDAGEISIETVGPVIERLDVFPERINVHAAQAVGREMVIVRTWERGAGATLACGTGACAVVVAGVLTGRLDREVRVRLPGGDLDVTWAGEGTPGEHAGVMVTGPAEEVYEGRASLDTGRRA